MGLAGRHGAWLAVGREARGLWRAQPRGQHIFFLFQTLYEENLATADDRATQDALLARLAADRDSSGGMGAALLAALPALPARAAAGAPRALAFVDADTITCQLAAQAAASKGGGGATGVSLANAHSARPLRGRRWLAIAADARLVLLDLASGERRDLARGALDSKPLTAVAALARPLAPPPRAVGGAQAAPAPPAPLAPALVVGTGGGSVFVVSLSTATPVARLAGGHRGGAVVAALPLASPAGDGDALLTAAADGTVALWTATMAGASASAAAALPTLSPAATFDASPSLLAACLAPAPAPAPGGGPLRLITLGAGGEVASWELGSWRLVGRGTPAPPRAPPDALAATPAPGTHTGGDAPVLLVGGSGGGRVFAARADAPAAPALCVADGTAALPRGTKKDAKVYALASHPTRAWTVALASNAGVLLLAPPAGAPPPTPPATPLPPLLGAPDRGGVAFAYAHGRALWVADFAAGWRDDGGVRAPTADLRARGVVADLPDVAGTPDLSSSSCGRYVCVVWRGAGIFAVFERPAEGLLPRASGSGATASAPPTLRWARVGAGRGVSAAWAAGAPRLAVLAPPPPPAPPTPGRVRHGSTRDEAAPPLGPATVDFIEFEGGASPGCVVAVDAVGARDGPPLALHGGAMLGVARGGAGGGCFTLHAWNEPATSTPPLPRPAAVAWAPKADALALALEGCVEVYTTAGGSLTRAAALPIARVAAASWDGARLLLITPDAVHVAVIGGLSGGGNGLAVDLATIAVASPRAPPPPSPLPPSRPTPVQRPPGPLTLAGSSESAVWVVDAAGRPHPLPASSAATRARALAAAGDVGAAVAVAERGLPRSAHADAAAFFAAAAGALGAAAGARLAGVPPCARAALLRAAGDAPGAVAALEVAAGVARGGGLAAGFGSAAFEAAAAETDAVSDSDAGSVPDWGAVAAVVDAAAAVDDGPDPDAAAALVADALATASAAYASGDPDATHAALRLALSGAPSLTDPDLCAVLLRAARGGVGESAVAAVARLAAAARAPPAATAFAAALAADPVAAAALLARAGDPARAALFLAAWKDGGARGAVAAWGGAAAAAAGGAGAVVVPPTAAAGR